MLGTYTHSRAAILCFGGWGLQLMLHLAPRLHAVQEQRAALQAQGPNLDRMTSFGALLPDPLLDEAGQVELLLRRPRPDFNWQPFLIERLLARIRHSDQVGDSEEELGEAVTRILTASERRAMQLLRAASPALAPMTYEGYAFRAPGTGIAGAKPPSDGAAPLRRATRRDVFGATLEHADPIARLAETYLLDPIRQDNLAPDDPYVQTTLYVVAPLFEPLAAAMIWPTVASIMARLGRRHISNVVALFATGGYADDLTRPIEDATAHATLAELEVLTGQRRDPAARRGLRDLVAASGSHLAAHVGESIFDHIYLLDREKSNQGLAEDSHELAVLAGNALEALVVGSGDLYIQEQLGFTIHTPGEKRPYSLIGAAGDYVPLQQILHAVNRQEESRLVREWVLRNTPGSSLGSQNGIGEAAQATPPAPEPRAGDLPYASLADLGFTERDALAQMARRMPDLFEHHALETVQDLAVSSRFILPPSAAAELRRVETEEWPEAFAQNMVDVRQTFQLAAGTAAIDEAWGIPNADSDTSLAVAAGLEGDDRHFPSLLVRMHKNLADMLAASPAGLTQAVEQTERWQREVEESLQKLRVSSTPSTRQLSRIQNDLNLREWTLRYANAVGRMPSALGILLRAAISVVFVALLSLLFLVVVQRPWDWVNDGWTLAGFAVGILLAAIFTYRVHVRRRTALRRGRVELAQTELTDQLRAEAHSGLVRAYTRLGEILQGWHDLLREAVQTLEGLSTAPTIPAVPPPGVEQTYLYQAHVNQALWNRCLDYLRSHLDTQGQRSEERLGDLWGTPQWRNRMQEILRSSAARSGNRRTSGTRRTQSQAQSLAEFIRQTVRDSVAPVSLQDDSPVREALLRALANEYSVEYLLWRGAAESRDIERRLRAMSMGMPSADLAAARSEQILTSRRYVESVWHRSKPTANYDVADRLAVYGITIDFAAVSGDPDSELNRTLLDEFGVAMLPTENPFTILFVRTVHGLALDDLDSMRRYREEMRLLRPAARAVVELVTPGNRAYGDAVGEAIYGANRPAETIVSDASEASVPTPATPPVLEPPRPRSESQEAQ